MKTLPKVVYEFGPFRVDPEKQVLLRGDEPIPITPRAFDVLLLFLSRSREVITKDELLQAIWPDSFVEEGNLTQNIFLLRKALGDTGDQRQYIITLPGRGYRFAAQVRTVTETGEALLAQMRSRTEILLEEQVVEEVPAAAPTLAGKALPMLPSARSRRWRWLVPTELTVAVLAVIAGVVMLRRSHPIAIGERDSVLVADFANATGDASFDTALRQGLEVQLRQSPYLMIVSEDRIQQVLRLMGQPPDTRLTGAVARDVCARAGSTALLEGSIQAIGTRYVLSLRATTCRTGELLDQEQIQVAAKQDVLGAVGQLTSRFRQTAGEPVATLQKHDLPLAEATTASLEALKAYSLGLKVVATQGEEASIPFFKRSVELDPNFAMAYAYLALMYGSTGASDLATLNARKAYDLRDHASDNERFFISAYYFGRATGNQERARQVCNEWAQTYPLDPIPHSFLAGFVYPVLGNYEGAIEAGRRAIELAPDRAFSYVNLGGDALYIDRFDIVREAIRGADERKMSEPELLVLRYDLAFAQNDVEGMQKAVDAAHGNPAAMDLLADRQAFSLAYHGQLRRARTISRQAIDIAQQQGDRERAAQFAIRSAVREAFFGDMRDSQQDAGVARGLAHNREVSYGAAVALALSGDANKADALALELEKDYPDDTSVHFNYLPVIRGILALRKGDTAKALDVLEVSSPYELGTPRSASTGFFGSLYPILIRGEAYLATHRGAEAAREFQKVIDHRGIMVGDPVSSLGHYGLARSLALTGEPAKARAEFTQALTTWKDADEDLPIVTKAREEYSALH